MRIDLSTGAYIQIQTRTGLFVRGQRESENRNNRAVRS